MEKKKEKNYKWKQLETELLSSMKEKEDFLQSDWIIPPFAS